MLHQIHHEISVHKVIPSVKRIFVFVLQILKAKKLAESFQKVLEKEVCVNVGLYLVR